MSVFFRQQERRDFGGVPAIPSNGEQRAFSIRSVNLASTDSAMQKVAIAAAVNLLASLTESLPMHVYSGEGQDRKRRPVPAWLQDLGAEGHGTPDWLFQGLYSAGLRGNLIGIIGERGSDAKPHQISLANPDDVALEKDNKGRTVWTVKGTEVPRDRLFHRRVYPIPGATLGASPIMRHALTIGGSLASEQYAAKFYTDGGHPTALFKNSEQVIGPKEAKGIKARYMEVIRGRREPLVVGRDWSYEALQVSQADAQYLETAKYSAAECARIYGPGMPELLGYETGGSMTYANVEQRAIDFVKFTMDPWLARFERWLSWLLPSPQMVQFERNALLRTDLLTRYRAHEIALRNEFVVVNEVRQIEDMPPVEWGDKPTATKAAAPIPVQMEGQ